MKKDTLFYAVRIRVILKYFGQLCLVLAGLTIVPLAVSLYFGEISVSLRYTIVLVVVGVLGGVLSKLRPPQMVQENEAIVLVAIMFLFTPLVMTVPMTGAGIPFMDAFFEAVSAGTTTGLSTLATVEDKPHAFLFARAWMQWYGGLGILVFALTAMIRPGKLTRDLSAPEFDEDDLVGGARAHARRVLVVYGIITVVGVSVTVILGPGLFDSVLYVLSAVSTGGFAPHDASLGALSSLSARIWITLLCLAGAVSFVFYRQIYYRGRKVIVSDVQTQGLIVISLMTCLVLGASMWSEGIEPARLAVHAPLIGLSAQTSAGFSTMDLTGLGSTSKFVLIPAMAVGGSVGSTAGGLKIIRLLILLKVVHMAVSRSGMARHSYSPARLGGRLLDDDQIREALMLILAFIGVIVFSWGVFIGYGFDPLDSLFEVVSAVGTVGLSAGLTGPDLPTVLKGVLCVDMLMGRLEIFAWLVLIYPRTWTAGARDVVPAVRKVPSDAT
jgi:trk system potassium uptake protein TrkH